MTKMSENRISQLPFEEILDSMTESLRTRVELRPLIVGVQTGGILLAEHLHYALQLEDPIGTLDISFYRDDFSRIGLHPKVRGSRLPEPIDNRHIILVDDVLHTGRTARAALNELFAWGRPASVILAVLLDRGNRELPLSADVTGYRMSLGNDQFVKISATGRLTYSDLETH